MPLACTSPCRPWIRPARRRAATRTFSWEPETSARATSATSIGPVLVHDLTAVPGGTTRSRWVSNPASGSADEPRGPARRGWCRMRRVSPSRTAWTRIRSAKARAFSCGGQVHDLAQRDAHLARRALDDLDAAERVLHLDRRAAATASVWSAVNVKDGPWNLPPI